MSGGTDLFVVCKSCGAEVSPYITECPYCGERLRKRAPKLDRELSPRQTKAVRPKLGRLRTGEIPGIRADGRPLGTLAILVASLGISLASRAGAFDLDRLAVVGKLGDEWWRVLTAPLVYANGGYQLVALAAVALFGWLLERRLGTLVTVPLFIAGGACGMLLVAVSESAPLAAGANGAALALVCAWGLPELLARARGLETDSDLLGAGVIAAVLLLLPLAVPEADALAGVGGALVGLLAGLVTARLRPVN